MTSVIANILLAVANADPDDGDPKLPPGTPPTYKYEGPWFTTQLTMSCTLGLLSFLIFSYCRTRWPVVFAPRTQLTGFSPHEAHAHQALFGWVLPTIRTSEFAVLQIVGLDAAVLLNFFKMSFYFFASASVLAGTILMPINLKNNVDIGNGTQDDDDDIEWLGFVPDTKPKLGRDWLDLINDANSYLSVHLIFTYAFTILALYFIHQNYKKFIRSRQLFSLELVHSVPARTVMVTHIPPHLRGERILAEYFENMGLSVESVSICREVVSLKRLLDLRTKALMQLEATWAKYVGNPSVVDLPKTPEQDPSLMLFDASNDESHAQQLVPGRRRPTIRLGWFKRVDALSHYTKEFEKFDDMVKKRRKSGRFKATHVAFITFEKMSSAQIAAQTAHAPMPNQNLTHIAPEPRDIIWSNISHSPASMQVRQWIVLGAVVLLLFFWLIPITALAGLLSYKEIKKTMPWLGHLIDANPQIQVIVQNSLPSVAMILLNATLPFLLEALCYVEGSPARSWIEYSLLKKYFLFLLINVVFIFLVASTYWQLVRDLANSPAKMIEKLADALARGQARHFFLSYVILQGLGIMPLQLLNLGVSIPRLIFRIFITRTPRDFAELNAPPMINYGTVYPQAILIFVITMLYSVIQPLILVFGTIYFGIAYVVYKYKLLFVFYKPYESNGQAWPITFSRLILGILIFIVFMIGIFILKKSFIIASLLAPLLAGTLVWSWNTYRRYGPLSKYVGLSSVCEVQRGEESEEIARLRAGHPVTWSQSNLNHRRYAENEATLYVAPEDERTDYSQPPMANWYSGVLNTGKRRYGHPALNGVLPTPWLPAKKEKRRNADGTPGASKDLNVPVVLSLRRKFSTTQPNTDTRTSPSGPSISPLPDLGESSAQNSSTADHPDLQVDNSNPWSDAAPRPAQPSTRRSTQGSLVTHRLSFDHGSGIIALPEDEGWLGHDDEESDSDEDYGQSSGLESSQLSVAPPLTGEHDGQTPPTARSKRYSTYYHHPERRRVSSHPPPPPRTQ